jgi:spermidine synthase
MAMIPWQEVARDRVPGGGELSLHRRGDEFVIRVDGSELMHSLVHGSEERLAELGCAHLAQAERPRVLIGGLGMGFTLSKTLDILPRTAEITIAELAPCVVEWNRGPLAHLTGDPLRDPRVRVEVTDVGKLMRTTQTRFDAILLDVDNGPQGLTRPANQSLYSETGLITARRALCHGGCLAVWSAAHHHDFDRRLGRAGFQCEVHPVRARDGRGPRHVVYVGRIDSRASAWAKLQTGSPRRRKRRPSP